MRKTAAMLFLLSAAAFVACVVATAAPARDAPISITSDQFVADSNAKTGTWSGNVVVMEGDIKMRADTMRADVASGNSSQVDKIYAKGHVVVDSPNSGTVTGDSGVYDVGPHLVTLTGHVVLTKDKDVMRGTELTVNLVTGQARLGAQGTPGGRVQGLFTAPPQTPIPPVKK